MGLSVVPREPRLLHDSFDCDPSKFELWVDHGDSGKQKFSIDADSFDELNEKIDEHRQNHPDSKFPSREEIQGAWDSSRETLQAQTAPDASHQHHCTPELTN